MNTKLTTPLAVAAALFVAAGGFVHAREWLDTYRDVPSNVPGVEVVSIGFPVTAALSAIVVLLLVGSAIWRPVWLRTIAVLTFGWQAVSIGALVLSREDSVFGWMEPTYTLGAEQTLAVEIGAMVCTAALVGLDWLRRREGAPSASPVTAG